MPKDRDQLTPAEPEDLAESPPRRSAATEAVEGVDRPTGTGPASPGSDPRAVDQVGGEQSRSNR
jgi:hypothetical protein